MPRGVAHPPELRAEAVAAVLAGGVLAEVARRYGISKGTLGNWLASQPVGTVGTVQGAREPASIEDLLVDLVAEHAIAIRAQLQAATRPSWLEKQSAADLAQLVVAERDTLIRLLAGFRPANDTPPGLPPPADTPPGPAEDGG